MLEPSDSELEERSEKVDTLEGQGIWVMWLVPNKELTDRMLREVSNQSDYPSLMLHDWHRVVVDPERFDDNKGVFYSEEEPFRMSYEDEYNVENVKQVSREIHYQNTVSLEDSVSSEFSEWLENACETAGINHSRLITELEDSVISDIEGNRAVVVGTRYQIRGPP